MAGKFLITAVFEPVEIIKGLDDTRDKELSGVVVETSTVSHDSPQFSSQAHFHQHVHVLTVLVSAVQPGERGQRRANKKVSERVSKEVSILFKGISEG